MFAETSNKQNNQNNKMGKIVGILSMQRVINYGSFLQAYALKQLLLQNGADEVYFIDIEKGRELPGFEYSKSQSKWHKLKRLLQIIFTGLLFQKIRDRKFSKRLKKSIEDCFPILELDKAAPKEFDLVVIGSDEVFNCCQPAPWGYTLQLYGRVLNAKKVVSYAGSFGHTRYEQLVQLGIDKEIGETMKTMAAISVRDQNSYDIVEKLTGIKAEMHLDPVLIYGYEKEIAERKVNYPEKYMVIYSYQGRINDKMEIKEITSFAKEHKLKLISIFCRYDWCDEAIIPETPFDVLGWFKGAEYVVTDTFHGTIFSIITGRKFVTLVRKKATVTNEEKVSSLLRQLEVEERCVGEDKKILGSILADNIDWIRVDSVLAENRKCCRKYLKGTITPDPVLWKYIVRKNGNQAISDELRKILF